MVVILFSPKILCEILKVSIEQGNNSSWFDNFKHVDLKNWCYIWVAALFLSSMQYGRSVNKLPHLFFHFCFYRPPVTCVSSHRESTASTMMAMVTILWWPLEVAAVFTWWRVKRNPVRVWVIDRGMVILSSLDLQEILKYLLIFQWYGPDF